MIYKKSNKLLKLRSLVFCGLIIFVLPHFYSCKVLSSKERYVYSDTIDLQSYEQILFTDLPKFKPFCRHPNHLGDIYWIDPEQINWFLCTNALYQGIEYTLCLSTQNIKERGKTVFIFTNDTNFIYSGYKIGDSVNNSIIEKLIYYQSEFSKIYYLPPNTWGIKIKNNRITEFCRTDYDGMAIDSVMSSNRFPAKYIQ